MDNVAEARRAYLKAEGEYFDAPDYPPPEKHALLKTVRATLEVLQVALDREYDDAEVD